MQDNSFSLIYHVIDVIILIEKEYSIFVQSVIGYTPNTITVNTFNDNVLQFDTKTRKLKRESIINQ